MRTKLRSSAVALVFLGGVAGFSAPAAAAGQCKSDMSRGTCCLYDDVLKREVQKSCNKLRPMAARPKLAPPLQALLPPAAVPAAAPLAPAVPLGVPAIDDAIAEETGMLGNPGNDKQVGMAGETPGNNEPGSFGDGVKGRSDTKTGGSRDTGGSDGAGRGRGGAGDRGGGKGGGKANGRR